MISDNLQTMILFRTEVVYKWAELKLLIALVISKRLKFPKNDRRSSSSSSSSKTIFQLGLKSSV